VTLAQADAAIGGKTAVNFQKYKNLVGLFHHPNMVVIDPSLLTHLPWSIYIDGFSEIVKHAIIRGGKWLDWIQENVDGILSRRIETIYAAVKMSVETKLSVIVEDYRDRNDKRIVLNFGHTMAHAIESTTSFQMTHGRAVSILVRKSRAC